MSSSAMFNARIRITLRPSILDVQGKAVHHAVESLGMSSIHDVRIGKYIELKVNCTDMEEARRVTEEACKRLLANPVMEDYAFTVEKA